MKAKAFFVKLPLLLLLPAIIPLPLKAQSNDVQKLTATILHYDSLFWQAYNACDLDKLRTFLTDDLEFYHDKGGLTTPLTNFMESVENGLCGNENWRLRREVVEGSLKVYPIPDYGAILEGEHVFYVLEKGKEERLDGMAKFTHVWQYKNNIWKMSRVLSYDHGPAPYMNSRKEVLLSDKVLLQYVGKYEAPQTGTIVIAQEGSSLHIQAEGFQANIFPETENTFFLKDRDVQFEFVKDDKDKVLKMMVRENGEIVEEARKIE